MNDPTDRVLELQRAASLCALRRYAEAISRLWMLLAREPHDGEALTLLAQAQLGDGDAQGALISATRAIAIFPDDPGLHRLASIACTRLAMDKEAIIHAETAVRLAPENADVHVTLALALIPHSGQRRVKAKLTRAQSAADRAVSLAADQAGPYLALGMVAAAAGDRTTAEIAFRRTLAIDPEHAGAHNELARLQIRRRSVTNAPSLAAAATGFATAVRTDPHAKVSRWNLDQIVRIFLVRLSWLIYLDAFFVSRLLTSSPHPGSRLIPIAILGIPALFAIRFITRLETDVQTHLRRMLITDRGLGAATALAAGAAILLLAAAAAPQANRTVFAGAAAVCGLLSRFALIFIIDKSNRTMPGRPPRPMLGTPILWLLAGTIALITVFLVAAYFDSHGGPIVLLIAVISSAGLAATLKAIRRRHTAILNGG